MVSTITENKYVDWLLRKVCNLKQMKKYTKLWNKLYSMEYTWVVPLDSSRASDGLYLRYEYNEDVVPMNDPCSILEMIVALAVRCENELMGDFEEDTASRWFWLMLENLDLDGMDDSRFDEFFVEQVCYIFMNNRYEYDGLGGLFYLEGCSKDVRNMPIWDQIIVCMNRIRREEGR